MTLEELYKIIEDRKKTMPKDSYVASLIASGNDRVIQKVGEEATEVVIAAKNNDKSQIVTEMADLWFHTLLLLANFDIKPDEIVEELERRNKK